MKLPADPHKPVQIRVSEENNRVPGKSGWYAYYIHGSILSVIDSCRLPPHGVYRTSMLRGSASGLLAATPKAPSRTAGHGFSVRLLSVRCMGIRFGLRDAALRIAGNGFRLRLSPFRQSVKPRMNCAFGREYQYVR